MVYFQNGYRSAFSREVLTLEARANTAIQTADVMRLSPQFKDLLYAQYLSHAVEGEESPFFSAISTLIEEVSLMDSRALEKFEAETGFSETDSIILSAI